MNEKEAHRIIEHYYAAGGKAIEEPAYEEASRFLVSRGDREAATDLGGYYYGKKDYDLALKYYTMGASGGVTYAWIGLGYIWYYGRTGERDYEKAYHCFAKAVENLTGESVESESFWDSGAQVALGTQRDYDEYINAVYKLADMYRAGHYVEKDYSRYALLVKRLYALFSDPAKRRMVPQYHLPELELRMAEIVLKEDEAKNGEASREATDTAIDLLVDARRRMAWRLEESQFFGNFSIMKSIVLKIYTLIDFDAVDMDLYDLYYVLREPATVTFSYKGAQHTVVAEQEGEGIAASLDGQWYHTVDELMRKARIGDDIIPEAAYDCYDFDISAPGGATQEQRGARE